MKWLEIALGLGVCAGGIYLMFNPINYGALGGGSTPTSGSSATATQQQEDTQINGAIAGAIAAAGASEAIGTALSLI
jgi:hypothetical protein